jgi:hypothetical protein
MKDWRKCSKGVLHIVYYLSNALTVNKRKCLKCTKPVGNRKFLQNTSQKPKKRDQLGDMGGGAIILKWLPLAKVKVQ